MHLVGFYYTNISRRTVLWMSNLTTKPLNAELNAICHLLAFLGVHHILHVSRIMVTAMLSFKTSETSYPMTQRRFPLDRNLQQFLPYRVFQDKWSVFWEVILSGIVRRTFVEPLCVSEGLPRHRYRCQNLQTPLEIVGLVGERSLQKICGYGRWINRSRFGFCYPIEGK